MKKEKTVSIWAPLRYANVGDDMQAIAFAIHIKRLGYDVKLYQLDEELAQLYDLTSVKTLDDLCSNVNLVLIAGGALLTPFRWYKRILNKAAREYEADFKDLYNATIKYPNTKFCAISMGGDGQIRDPKTWYSRWRIAFLRSDTFINGTVRLKGDVEQMKKAFDKDFEYHADMLFRVTDYFNYKQLSQTEKIRICVQFKKGRYLDEKLLNNIFQYAKNHNDIEFHFITTHMPKIGLKYQYIPPKETSNIYIDNYETPSQMLGLLASCDLIMTSMLHVGLMGLTVGTPFVSYRGPSKTKNFLHSIGGKWAILPDHLTFEELLSNYMVKKKSDLYSQYDCKAIASMMDDSKNQYIFCDSILEKYA